MTHTNDIIDSSTVQGRQAIYSLLYNSDKARLGYKRVMSGTQTGRGDSRRSEKSKPHKPVGLRRGER